ncbi:MAG: DNA polymerase I, partial [Alphaproteobacteria bacterium]|nr:DNA polymerase I [Alphaproteobacteria bacterium]
MSFGKGCHLHLIDGSAFIFRAYHALPPLTRKSDGLPIGAVSGFCNMLARYVDGNGSGGRDAATHAAVVFDFSARTFRNDLYPLYKAQRPEPPEDLRPQFPLTRDATRAFNLPALELEGFEADDIIATLAREAREAGGHVMILSSDKDLMQLIGGGVEMLDPMKNRRIGPDEVVEKFGVGPERVIDVQALSGDSVDNIPGAPGIGAKTAAQLIAEFGDLETLLDRAAEIPQPKRRAAIMDNIAQIRLSRRLVTLEDRVPLPFGLDELEVRPPHAEALLAFLARMEFRTLTRRVAEKMGVEAPAIPEPVLDPAAQTAPEGSAPAPVPFDTAAYVTIRDAETLRAWVAEAEEQGFVAIDTETTSLDEMRAELVGVSLGLAPGRAAYVPLGHVTGGGDLFGAAVRAPDQIDRDAALAILRPMLEDAAVLKIGQNMKYDWKILAR